VTPAEPPPTKKDRIVTGLRSLIASGEIPRGERIQQDELAARFETSITPVREALRQLEAEGLLVSEPHRGVRVATADLDRIKGVYVARRLLEPYAAQRSAFYVSRRDLTRARDLIHAMRRVDGPSPELSALNRDFHFLFYERCGVPFLVTLLDSLWRSYPWDILHVLSSRAGEAIDEHERMVAAIEGGDPARIEDAFAANLRNSYVAVVRHFTGADVEDPFELPAG
jgi:DNA-binding GntR family transcriptional regulator